VLWPIDRALIDLVWGDGGFPARDAYRAYERRTPRDHRLWANDGRPYDVARARAQVHADAREFVARAAARVADGGICVCAFDTELFGHWWYEGVDWLAALIDEAAAQDLELVTLDDALETSDPAPAPDELPVTSWGRGGDLRTWSWPKVAEFAWQARTAELRAFAAPALGPRAARELLALQASDWAFLADREWADDYPAQRARAHVEAFERAIDDPETSPTLRNLAPFL
jgi:1,4-alpha-glucan branching enzyme